MLDYLFCCSFILHWIIFYNFGKLDIKIGDIKKRIRYIILVCLPSYFFFDLGLRVADEACDFVSVSSVFSVTDPEEVTVS